MIDNTSAANHGVVVSVRGSVVDVRFDAHLPPIYSVLRAGAKKEIVVEVLAQRDAHHVRGIALTPTQGLARGMAVTDTGGPLKAPVGKGILSRMFDVFGDTIDRGPALSDVQWRPSSRLARSCRDRHIALPAFFDRWHYQPSAGPHHDQARYPLQNRSWWRAIWHKLLAEIPNCNAVAQSP